MNNPLIGIYIIKNKINGKFYVGQTKNYFRRIKQHKNRLQQEDCKIYNKLYPALKKYGVDNFEFKFIEQCDIPALNNKEMEWINKLNSYNNGYNATLGGHRRIAYMTGKHHTEYTKRQISLTLTGRKDSDMVKLHKSQAMKGRHPLYATIARQRKVKCIETGNNFNSLLNAAKYIHRHSTGILSVLEGRQKTCGGYHWIEIKKEK